MLISVIEENLKTALTILNRRPDLNVRVSGLLKAYGLNRHFFRLWVQNESTLLARLEGSFFLCNSADTDYDEIAFFLRFNPYFQRLFGTAEAVAAVEACLESGGKLKKYDFLEFEAADAVMPEREVICNPNLNDVYEVMCKVGFQIGDFMPWYADVSHRIRHGCARAFLIKVGDKPVSSCLVSAESDTAGLLSGIGTVEDYRSRGFASDITRFACKKLTDDKKCPVLECCPAITAFYARLGFRKTAETAELIIK